LRVLRIAVMPQKPVCTRCGVSPTYHWVQLTGLLLLLLSGGEWAGGVVFVAAHGGEPSRLPVLSGLGVVRPECIAVRLDTHSCGATRMDFLVWQKSEEGESRAEN